MLDYSRDERCNFCFRWFDSHSKIPCPLNICHNCFNKADKTNNFRVASPIDGFLYEVLLIKTLQLASEEEMLLTQDDSYKNDAYCILKEEFKKKIEQQIRNFKNCRQKLDYLDADATFQDLKAIVDSLSRKSESLSVAALQTTRLSLNLQKQPQKHSTKALLKKTTIANKTVELSSEKLQEQDFAAYLNLIDWTGIQTIKFVKIGLTDKHFMVLLDFLKKQRSVVTLMVDNNQLTVVSLEALQQSAENISVRNLHMGNNMFYIPRAKQAIRQLRSKFNIVL